MVAAFLLVTALSGCGEEQPEAVPSATQVPTAANLTIPVLPTPTAVEEMRSSKVRSAPLPGTADLAELLRGNNAFAFDLYRALSDGEGALLLDTTGDRVLVIAAAAVLVLASLAACHAAGNPRPDSSQRGTAEGSVRR